MTAKFKIDFRLFAISERRPGEDKGRTSRTGAKRWGKLSGTVAADWTCKLGYGPYHWQNTWRTARNVSERAPCRTRTCDPRIRNPLLYPAELRAQLKVNSGRYYAPVYPRGKEI